ncbi:aminotransferase class IV [Leucobacter sp. wl10]|uniref:aminotransferase class IV n=1 Tax=Leucobacter sp. wl10 TaxID=2304677 RepID=UPI0013C2BECB|nr:aminotransferase class IV [Leucobacter sp. wl10]
MANHQEFVHLTRPLLDGSGVACEIRAGMPRLDANDLGVTRGFGAFEVVHGKGRSLLALEAHLARFERSLSQLGLPALALDAWRLATARVVDESGAVDEEFALRYVVTAGAEGVPASGWIRRYASPAELTERRLYPRSAMVLNRGTALGESTELPWLLHGVKSLSYAGNLLGERIATEAGCDDAIYATRDGYLLEGTTAALLWQRDGVLYTTDYAHGVLPGTTQQAVFEAAPTLGLGTEFGALTLSELGSIEGAWLMSAMRLATAIGSIDGRAISVDMELTARLNESLFASMRETS